ncbi:TIGR03943 family putative permease subunit [Paenibacillus agilis]|uniref:TIGR03943 family protein n=1 Tax=Paenibacillus agilis TaxID=3020863 RepID=A0A559IZD4_9BACL|nr:TIGR03943 family protein [Paenibacillus agilis]TVX92980.1 TIGR03943 family protein [Paenibacillus agilis]
MSEDRNLRTAERKMKLFCACLLLGWSFLIVYITKQQLMPLYVAPRMEWLVKGSALVCYILGIFQVYMAFVPDKRSDPSACNCTAIEIKHKRGFASSLSSCSAAITLLLPFILTYVWPPMPLSSQAAALKGIQYAPSASLKQWTTGPTSSLLASKDNTTPSNPTAESLPPDSSSSSNAATEQSDTIEPSGVVSKEQEQLPATSTKVPTFEADEFTQIYADLAKQLYNKEVIVVTEEQYMEIILTLDLFKEQFAGKRIRIPGFVYQDKEMEKGRFAIARFSMQCCTADASPFGILSINHTKQNVKADEWVEGEGVLTIAKHENNQVMLLKIDSLRSIPAKEDPYVYPDFNFGS